MTYPDALPNAVSVFRDFSCAQKMRSERLSLPHQQNFVNKIQFIPFFQEVLNSLLPFITTISNASLLDGSLPASQHHAMDNRNVMHLGLPDLKTAFDTVDINLLNERLERIFRFKGKILQWL